MLAVQTAGVRAQTADGRVGRKVILQYKTVLKIGHRDVDPVYQRTYKVEKAQDEWLWLVSSSMAGWAKVSDVIAYDQAIDDCTQVIRTNLASASANSFRGALWLDKGESDIAMADCNEAIRLMSTTLERFCFERIACRVASGPLWRGQSYPRYTITIRPSTDTSKAKLL